MQSWFRFTSPLPPGRGPPIPRNSHLSDVGAAPPWRPLSSSPAHVLSCITRPKKGEENLSSTSVQQGESQ